MNAPAQPAPQAAPLAATEPAGPAQPASPAPSGVSQDEVRFVAWLRQVAPYIHAFRGKTFVVAVPGELIQAGWLNPLVQDLSLLHAMGMRIVV
ncbi:MAG TPA: N-acetylglutamate synthase, partial [Burkholderiaceae bacterium]|nr:N-acetylglutamate synthase [Burkholderiaceae bacterium]